MRNSTFMAATNGTKIFALINFIIHSTLCKWQENKNDSLSFSFLIRFSISFWSIFPFQAWAQAKLAFEHTTMRLVND